MKHLKKMEKTYVVTITLTAEVKGYSVEDALEEAQRNAHYILDNEKFSITAKEKPDMLFIDEVNNTKEIWEKYFRLQQVNPGDENSEWELIDLESNLPVAGGEKSFLIFHAKTLTALKESIVL